MSFQQGPPLGWLKPLGEPYPSIDTFPVTVSTPQAPATAPLAPIWFGDPRSINIPLPQEARQTEARLAARPIAIERINARSRESV